jgi:hypothetical protein
MKTFAISVILFFGIQLTTFSQTASIGEESVVVVTHFQQSEQMIYTFLPTTSFNEARSQQVINRFNTVTGDNATVTFKSGKVIVKIHHAKFTESQKNDLLFLLAKAHGYSNYQFND